MRARLLRGGFHHLGRWMPGLTARIAYGLWYRPGSKHRAGGESLVFKQAERIPLEWHGKQVAVYGWGKGSPVLLVHGWGSRASGLDTLAGALVATGNRVIAFDAPAHGRSAGRRTNVFEIIDVILELDRIHGRCGCPLLRWTVHSPGSAPGTAPKALGLHQCPSHFHFTLASYGRMLNLPPKVVARLSALVEDEFGADI